MNKKNKKIIVIAPFPPPFGGIAFITKSLFKAGLEDKFDVVHLNTSKGTLTEIFNKITLQDIFLSIWNLVKLFRFCIKEKNIKYALILGTNGSAIIRIAAYMIILKIFSIKIITNLHGTRFYNQRKGIIKKLNNFVINNSELILSPTKIDMDGISPHFEKANHIKLFYNSTHLDAELLSINNIQKNNSELTIIGIGRLSQVKGAFDLLDTCIDLIKSGYNIKFTWIGRGAFEVDDAYVEQLISKQPSDVQKRINIYKDIDEKTKYQLLINSDLFVLPSYSDNLPISILEAMAFGLPIISTKIGAIPEVIRENENGWLIQPGNNTLLKTRIVDFVNRNDSFSEMKLKNKYDFLKKFYTTQRIKELEEYLV